MSGSRGSGTRRWDRFLFPTSASLAAMVTVAAVTQPGLRVAYRDLSLHIALETVGACAAALVSLLLYGRFRRSRSSSTLLLAGAMALLAAAALVFTALTTAVHPDHVTTTATWAPLLTRAVAAVLFVAAAALPDRTVATGVGLGFVAVGALTVLVGLWSAVYLLRHQLPPAVPPGLIPGVSVQPHVTGAPAVLAVLFVNGLLYGAAASLLTARADRTGDELTTWIGAAAVVNAIAHLTYLLYPSLYTDWVYIGDVLRTAAYLMLLVGALRELRAYWSDQVEGAALDERHRLARDLHDGPVQDLGYIRAQAQLLRQVPGAQELAERVVATSERAIDETRDAIAVLGSGGDEPLAVILERSAGEIGDRYDVSIKIQLDGWQPIVGHERDEVVRIVREALSNAARHGDASHITVEVKSRHVVVRDDGRGFDTGVRATGFGLQSMHERAAALGASLHVASVPGGGTSVLLELP